MKLQYRKSRAPTAVSMQSICARVHLQSGVYYTILLLSRKSVWKQKLYDSGR